MAQILTFKCPGCGGYLEFDPTGQDYACPYCGKRFTQQDVEELSAGKAREAAFDAQLRSYHCQSCGAEIVTDDTTAATRCYYCHNPVVLTDRLSGSFHPDAVIPFKLSREEARKAFAQYMSKHRFVDRRFFTEDQMESFSGVYYPYWLGDIDGEATFDGEGTRVHVVRMPRETITTTEYYAVHREGRVGFRSMVRKALSKADRQLSDGIHPYELKDAVPFEMSYLSGFLAEKRDIEEAVTEQDMFNEAQGYVTRLMKKDSPYDSLNGKGQMTSHQSKLRYVLLPAWVLTYRAAEPGKTFYFMMNAQSGKTCGRLPVNKKKLALWAAGLGVVVAGLLMLGGRFLW